MTQTNNKRTRLISAATSLIHQQGYHSTTLADIADAANVPLGNVYYYFKTKQDIGTAVINTHTDMLQKQFADWEHRAQSPLHCLQLFLQMPLETSDIITAHGCPIGSLCQELNKSHHPLALQIDQLLKQQLLWVEKQFAALHKPQAKTLAIQFISMLQGCIVVAQALQDPNIINVQVKQLQTWLQEIV